MPEIVIHGQETQEVRLGLRRDNGRVYLVALTEGGDVESQGYLLEITSIGAIRRCCTVNESLGFKLDENGKIAVV